jgi:hypothetical protein
VRDQVSHPYSITGKITVLAHWLTGLNNLMTGWLT